MKKSYLTLAVAAVAFAACSDNSVKNTVTEDFVEIGFASDFVDNSTKADLTMDWFNADGNSFGVYGYKKEGDVDKKVTLYTNEMVTRNATAGNWTHPTTRFWDKAASDAYDFYAYAPYVAETGTAPDLTYNPTFNKEKGFTFSGLDLLSKIEATGIEDKAIAIAENKDYLDVCTASDDVVTSAKHTNAIAFTFNHVLSKLSFKAYTTATGVTSVTITKIEMDFPTGTGEWAQTAVSAVAGTTNYDSYTVKDANFETTVYSNATGTALPTTSATAVEIGEKYIVLPINETYKSHAFDVKVTYTIVYTDGETESGCVSTGSVTIAPVQNEWDIVKINVNPAAIEFCVEAVNDWTKDETNHSVEVN